MAGCWTTAQLPGGIADVGGAVILPPQHAAGDTPAVDFGGAVIDAERAHVAEDAGDDRVVGDAEAAQDLHAAVDDAPDCLGADDLGHAGLVRPALAAVEDPGGVPDHQPGLVQIHLVVGEHEADTLVLAERLAERSAPPRVIDGCVVGAARGAEPAHAMRQTGRRETHLSIAEAFT